MIYTDSNVITLDRELKGDFTICTNQKCCIFKVKANAAGLMQTKPTHGFIPKQGRTAVSVRFIEKVPEIDKVKLKVYYLPVTSAEMPAGSIAETYKKMKQEKETNEQFLTFTFQINGAPPQQSIKEFRYSSLVKTEKKTQRERPIRFSQISQSSSIKEETEQPLISSIKMPIKQNQISLISIVFVAFLLGIAFGIKMTRLQIDLSLILRV